MELRHPLSPDEQHAAAVAYNVMATRLRRTARTIRMASITNASEANLVDAEADFAEHMARAASQAGDV